MPKQNGHVRTPNSILSKFEDDLDKIGAYAIRERLIYQGNPAANSPRGLGRVLGWSHPKVIRFLRDIKDLERNTTDVPEAYQSKTTESKDSGASRTTSVPEAYQAENPDLILAFKEEEKETTTTKKLPIEHPDWLDSTLWAQFVANRKAMKKPMTDHAQGLAIKKLRKLIDEGDDQTEVLEAAIIGGWQGLFSVKGKNGRHDPYKPKGSEGLKSFDEQGAKGGAF